MPTHLAASEVNVEQVRAQCDRILSSNIFLHSIRQSAFLDYVVTAKLEGRSDTIKEFAIAFDVFERDKSFDPNFDSIVRVEASRLRSKLREYYDDEGAGDQLRIEIPKGHYVPVFSPIDVPDVEHNSRRRPRFLGRKNDLIIIGVMAVAIAYFAVTT